MLRISSTDGGNRTPNQRFWRPPLYQLSYVRKYGKGGGSRTPNRLFWRQLLYQLSYALIET